MNAWLRRMWVRQEIFAARKVVVKFSADAVDWQSFCELLDKFELIDEALDHGLLGVSSSGRAEDLSTSSGVIRRILA